MCSLRDAAEPFEKLSTRVFGISTDDVRSQAAFHAAQKLNFSLLSDPDGSVASKFGVLGQRRPYARRKTFVIDPKGKLRHVSDRVDVSKHGAELAALLRKLQAE